MKKAIEGFVWLVAGAIIALVLSIDPAQAQVKPGTTCPPVTVCEATTRGPLCHTMMCDVTGPPLCLDGNAHVVPCDQLREQVHCDMKLSWDLGKLDRDTVRVTALTPQCASEALEASSRATTRIIQLREAP